MAAENEPTDLGADPARHNPDLDAAFGDLDEAAAKLADAADRLTEAGQSLGVAGNPLRHNPDLDAAFGIEPEAPDLGASPWPEDVTPWGDEPGDAAQSRPVVPMPPAPAPTPQQSQTAQVVSPPAADPTAGWTQDRGPKPSPGQSGWDKADTAKQLAGPTGGMALAAQVAGQLGQGSGALGVAGRVAGPLFGHLAGGGDKNTTGGIGGALMTAAGFLPGPIGAAAKLGGMVGGLFGGAGGGAGGGPGGGSSPSGLPSGGSGAGGSAGSSLAGPGASGVAETAQKIAGMIPLVGDVVNGLAKFAKQVVESADAQHKLNMQYADASAAMAGVLAEAEMRDWQREREIGDKTAETARDLAESRANYQDSMGKIEALFSNIKNEVFAKLLDVLNTVLEPIAELVGSLNDAMFEQARSTAADGWLDEVDRRAKARQQAGDEWFRVRRGGD